MWPFSLGKWNTCKEIYGRNGYLSIIKVVAEVPSIEIEAINERRVIGMSSRREKSVVFHDRTQSTASPFFLDN